MNPYFQLVLLILGCFSVCWLPYFIVACAQIFEYTDRSSPTVYKAAFTLALANSGMNPLIYAWKNTALRKAFGRLLRCRHPDHPASNKSSTNRRRIRDRTSADRQRGSIPATSESFSFDEQEKRIKLPAAITAMDYVADPALMVMKHKTWEGVLQDGSAFDRRLVDILHIDIGVVAKSIRLEHQPVQRYSTSIIPMAQLEGA